MCKQCSVALAVVSFVAAIAASPTAPGQGNQQPAPKKTPKLIDHFGDPLPEHALLRVGTAKSRNNAMPQALAFVRGTDRLVTIDQSTGGHVWDAKTGHELLGFGHFESGVAPFAISADGTLAALVESPDICQIYETKKGRKVHALQGTWSKAWKLCFSPDNALLASTGSDGHLLIWDIAKGTVQQSWECKDAGWRRLNIGFSPDGKLLALGSWFDAVDFWEIATRRHFTVGQKSGGCSALAISLDTKYLARISADPHRLTLWEISTGTQIHEFPSEPPYWCVRFAPDGKTLATGNGSGTISIWDAATGKLERLISGQSGDVDNLAFSHDGKYLAAASGGCTIAIYDVASGKQLHLFPGHHLEVSAARFLPNGDIVSLCTPWYGGSMLRISDAVTGKTRSHTALHSEHVGAWLAADGAIVAIPGDGAKVVLHNALTGKVGPTIDPGDESVRAWHVSQDGRAIAAVIRQAPMLGTDSSFAVWDAATGSTLVSHAAKDKQFTCQFTDDGRYLAVLNKVWLSGEWDPQLRALGFGPPASLATGSLDFWDLATGHKTFRVGPQLTRPRLGTFSPNGRLMAVDNGTNAISVLELCTGKVLKELRQQGEQLFCFAFSPNSRLVAATTAHGNVLLWDLALEHPLVELQGSQSGIHTLSFSKDSKRMLSCAQDKTILVWDVSAWTGRVAVPKALVDKQDLPALWSNLGDNNPVIAYATVSQMLAFPKETIALLRKHMGPAQKFPANDLARWIADLNSDRFAVREAATVNIRKLGHAAQSALERVLEGKANLEVVQRVRHLLSQLETQALPREQLQQLRALDILEMLATPDAIDLLDTLSKGDPDTWLTQEAAWALKRTQKRVG